MDAQKPFFDPVESKVNFPKLESEITKFWKKERIFEKSVESRSKSKRWTFLDGPPFITGLPHYGSLLSGLPKDVFPRYFTMKGHRVRRVWGWDCHGLPVENKVEGKLGIKRKKEIETKVGVTKFIAECKAYVGKTSSEWEWYIDKIARWVDFKNAYKTMDRDYMESVMWVFKSLYDKGYIYKGLRVGLFCPHCSTPISNFEVAMDVENYKDETDHATVYKYRLLAQKNTFLLAWSTTPWNKLATPALAVNPNLKYVKVKQGKESYILAKATLPILHKTPKYRIISEFFGTKLVGEAFKPHYDFYEIEKGKRAFVVIGGDFVTAEEGTGIVTIAAYGEEDLEIMQKENIQVVLHVDEEGIVSQKSPIGGGKYYLDVDLLVNADLKKRGLVYRDEKLVHSVAHCWRCGTRLFYAPQNAWFVAVSKLKAKMKRTNRYINWYPKHFKYGRFLKSLEAAPDWCISRSRYWGSPVPVWECACGWRYVPSSIRELEMLSRQKIKDLHKPKIDRVTIKCNQCGQMIKRVPEVLDSWIEAGSAAFAEHHFPFRKTVSLKDFFPPDFVTEYTGQIRAWFYVLHVIANALELAPKPNDNLLAKNVLVTGVILGSDGRKMSKNFGNYPDPREMLETYGGDALRLYLLGSPVMHGEDILISGEEYRNQIKLFLLPLWNVYNFFVTYANLKRWQPSHQSSVISHQLSVLDQWILSRLGNFLTSLEKDGYEAYDTVKIYSLAQNFIVNDLSAWYIRRSRERADDQFFSTLWFVLVNLTKAIAPLAPFVSEAIFKNLTKKESVHLESWPQALDQFKVPLLEKKMAQAVALSSAIHAFRKKNTLRVRLPIRVLSYHGPARLSKEVLPIILEETNVYELNYLGKAQNFKVSGSKRLANLDVNAGEARDIVRLIQLGRKNLGVTLKDQVQVSLPSWPPEYQEYIMKRGLVSKLVKGERFSVVKESLK